MTRMSYIALVLAVFTAATLSAEEGHQHWSYLGRNGPTRWGVTGHEDCGGRAQSPINLNPDTPVFSYLLDNKINAKTYGKQDFHASNNGHSASFDFVKKAVGLSGTGLPGEFIPIAFHFHWGSTKAQGSEHLQAGYAYPLEMHVVHINKKYKASEAAVKKDGLAVLGFFFQEAGVKDNRHFQPILDILPKLVKAKSKSSLNDFNLYKLMSSTCLTKFYRYQGSLTTPGCNESVTWTMFGEPIQLSKTQIKELKNFRDLKDEEGQNIIDNFRPIQPLNGRFLLKSKHFTEKC